MIGNPTVAGRAAADSEFAKEESHVSQRTERESPLAERELTALWLLGRTPIAALPLPVLRFGRAGRGPGPDVREVIVEDDGRPIAGDVEVHLRAADFRRHGHYGDMRYRRVLLHLVWDDDRPAGERGGPTEIAPGRSVPTVTVGPALRGGAVALRRALRRGPAGGEPCTSFLARVGLRRAVETIRTEGRARFQQRTDHASALAEAGGWTEAFHALLRRALESSAGRRHESAYDREQLLAQLTQGLEPTPELAFARMATRADAEHLLISAFMGGPSALNVALPAVPTLADRPAAGTLRTEPPHAQPFDARTLDGSLGSIRIGQRRARELAWNAALPVLAGFARAEGNARLEAAVCDLIERWPAPAPYGRTHALRQRLGIDLRRFRGRHAGALAAQGLLHLQDLWCQQAGCGLCPCSPLPLARRPGAAPL